MKAGRWNGEILVAIQWKTLPLCTISRIRYNRRTDSQRGDHLIYEIGLRIERKLKNLIEYGSISHKAALNALLMLTVRTEERISLTDFQFLDLISTT